MAFAQRNAAIGVVLDATEETAAIEQVSLEWRWYQARLVFVAEAVERIVLVRELVIHAHIKVGAVSILYGIGDIVVTRISGNVCRREQRKDACSQGVDQAARSR